MWIAWAILALAVAVPLALAKGHPPGLVFVPFVAAAWLVGHLLILAVGWLGNRLAVSRPETAAAAVRPIAQRIAGTLLAAVFLGGTGVMLFIAVSLILQHERWGVLGTLAVVGAVAVWALHGAVLAGLAAGRVWALAAQRWTLAAWGVVCAWLVVGGALDGRPGIVAVGLVGLALTGWLVFALRPRAHRVWS